MRRIASIIAFVVAAFAVLQLVWGPSARSADTYRVDAIFDTAKGIIPGQLVKIAGARVGEVKNVTLTEEHKARIQMEIDAEFAPFRDDARCEIRPEGLISENFVQCTPGTPDGKELRGDGDVAPTVPVENTTVPVNLSDLFQLATVPVRQRLSLVIANLGMGVAGRGEDLNELLRRSNPALQKTQQVIDRLNAQRTEIRDVIRSSDAVIAELTERSPSIRRFVDEANRLTERIADNRDNIRRTLRTVPALLDETEPTVDSLDRLATEATPVLDDLRESDPQVRRLLDDIAPFSRSARPALQALSDLTPPLRRAVASGRPLVAQTRTFARAALPTGRLLNTLVSDMKNRGVTEGLASFMFFVVQSTARFDTTSHLLPAKLQLLFDCSQHAEAPAPGCSAKFDGEPGTQRLFDRRRSKAAPRATATPGATRTPAPQRAKRPKREAPVAGVETPRAPRPVATPKVVDEVVDQLEGTVRDLDETVKELTDGLLEGVSSPNGVLGKDGPLLGGGRTTGPRDPAALSDLADLLLGP